jgi:hypothetical protein
MGWSEVRDAAGNVVGSVHICDRGRRRQRCSTPGCGNPASKLCDYPVKAIGRKTCDAAICARCAKKVGPDRDYCVAHSKAASPPVPETPRQTNGARAGEAQAPGVGVRSPEDERALQALLKQGIDRDAALEMLGVG